MLVPAEKGFLFLKRPFGHVCVVFSFDLIKIVIGFILEMMHPWVWFRSVQCNAFGCVSGTDVTISSMARMASRVTNQVNATGNALQRQHARKAGKEIRTIFTR